MKKRWVIKEQGDKESVRSLAHALNINTTLANLLVLRGIKSYEEAKAFFRPELSHLHDPFLMKDMNLAIERIETAISKGERILIYGDYDVDGTTAVALVYTYFKNLYEKVDFYIPDRYTEGYGISYQGIDYAHQNGFTLVIALDCGIKAVEKILYAREKQVDFIIADHHRPGDELPAAAAVLDPQRTDCQYPYKELSGCGIGFKLVQAFSLKNKFPFSDLKQYFDLVVVSIASDIVPITGENRVLSHYGLKLMNSKPRPGLEVILKLSNVKKSDKAIAGDNGNSLLFSRELTISDIVFLVGPRINAAGRIQSGRNSVELLISRDLDEAMLIGKQINEFNTERKNLDSNITQQALEMISSNDTMMRNKSTVVYNPTWSKGVIGIVASRLTETYYRPTIVLTDSNSLVTGSARSVKDFDIYDAIDACSHLLEHFGGHKYAAGLSLKPENLAAFMKKFEEIVGNTIQDHMLIPEIEIDSKLNLNTINGKFFRVLKQFAPFGPGNMSPIFVTEGVIDTGSARVVGNNHLKLEVFQPNITGFPMQAIGFQLGEYHPLVKSGTPFNICYHIEENEWNSQTCLQLNLKDLKVTDDSQEDF